MTLIASNPQYIQNETAQAKAICSESSFQAIGGTINYLLDIAPTIVTLGGTGTQTYHKDGMRAAFVFFNSGSGFAEQPTFLVDGNTNALGFSPDLINLFSMSLSGGNLSITVPGTYSYSNILVVAF